VDGDGAYLKPLDAGSGSGTVYVVAALGGSAGSNPVDHNAHLVKINGQLGFCAMDVNSNRLDFQFIAATGVARDHFTMLKDPHSAPPAIPEALAARVVSSNQVWLTWQNTPTNEMGFKIEGSPDGLDFAPLATLGANLTNYTNTVLLPGTWLYRIRAWNGAGDSDYSNLAAAEFITPPAIVQQPQSTTVAAGAFATFAVTAEGSWPLGYQWRFNELRLEDQTNSMLTLFDLQPGHAGRYTVVVTNTGGSATSAVANLTVVLPPVLSPALLSNQQLGLRVNGAVGETLRIQRATNLTPPIVWREAETVVLTNAAQTLWMPLSGPASFYRAQRLGP
jgi:hypothetical protein